MDKKKVDVLVSTMNIQNDYFEVFDNMNITGNGIVCNQTNEYHSVSDISKNRSKVIISVPHRGIGQSRNNLLINSNADICILSDDDMVFYDEYEKKVLQVFEDNIDADVVIFNLNDGYTKNKTVGNININRFNYKKYGAARFAFRRESIMNHSITFSMKFGASTYGSGEDTLFLRDCLKKGLKIIAVEETIAKLNYDRDSTWFKGYDEKYFFDKGALYYALNPMLFFANALQFSIRKSKLTNGEIKRSQVLSIMFKGAKHYKDGLQKEKIIKDEIHE